jgi:hypothetical protein
MVAQELATYKTWQYCLIRSLHSYRSVSIAIKNLPTLRSIGEDCPLSASMIQHLHPTTQSGNTNNATPTPTHQNPYNNNNLSSPIFSPNYQFQIAPHIERTQLKIVGPSRFPTSACRPHASSALAPVHYTNTKPPPTLPIAKLRVATRACSCTKRAGCVGR